MTKPPLFVTAAILFAATCAVASSPSLRESTPNPTDGFLAYELPDSSLERSSMMLPRAQGRGLGRTGAPQLTQGSGVGLLGGTSPAIGSSQFDGSAQ